jgi:PAS domain S-box-containing protein
MPLKFQNIPGGSVSCPSWFSRIQIFAANRGTVTCVSLLSLAIGITSGIAALAILSMIGRIEFGPIIVSVIVPGVVSALFLFPVINTLLRQHPASNNNGTTDNKRILDFIEVSSDWYWETDSKGIFTFVSGINEERTGISTDSIVGSSRDQFLENFAENDLGSNPGWHTLSETIRNHEPYEKFRYTVRKKNGQPLVLEASAKPFFNSEGMFLGYRGIGHDVTEDQRNLDLLKDSIESFSAGFALFDEKDRLVLFNDHYFRMVENNIKGTLQIGRTFEQLMRLWIDGDAYPLKVGDREEFISKRLEHHKNAPSQREHQLNDGRWVLVSEYRTSAGGTTLVQTDISDRKNAEIALQQSQADYRNLMEGSIQGVLITSLDRKPLFANGKCAEIFGYESAEELMQIESTLQLIAPHELKRLDEIREPFLDGPNSKSVAYEFEGVRKDGKSIWLGLQGGAVEWKGQRAAHLALVDVTERRQAEEDRRVALVEAEQANQAKSDFLATMSHELRTPLNAIIGFSDMIEGQYFGQLGSEKYREYAHDITSSSKHLLELVNDILDLSAIEAGKQPLMKENLVLAEVVADCTPIIISAANEKNIDFRIEIPNPFPPLFADRRAIKQILFNLLSNSVKYTLPGGQIVLRAFEHGQGCKLEVRDNGVGVPPEKLATMTDPFVRSESDPLVAQEGSGLGLAIVKSLVELHDGNLEIKSGVGVGTVVAVILPGKAIISD